MLCPAGFSGPVEAATEAAATAVLLAEVQLPAPFASVDTGEQERQSLSLFLKLWPLSLLASLDR